MEQTLGKRIMTNRKRLGLTQDQLAEKLNVTAQAVSKWENDQSCPDISILPQLADIFHISTDTLLGREAQDKIHYAEVITDEEKEESEGVHFQKGNFTFTFDNGKRGGILVALLVLTVGILYLLARMLMWNITFWEILLPSAMLVFGLSGIYPKFSLLRLAVGFFGAYTLFFKISRPINGLDADIFLAVCILIIGVDLLIKSFKKPNKPRFHVEHSGDNSKEKQQFEMNETSFAYKSSFGSCTQPIDIPVLEHGIIECAFGEYVIDLSGVQNVHKDCTIDAKCACGELRLLIPDYFTVKQNCSTALAEVVVKGQPSTSAKGQIKINAKASMGEIVIEYI